MTAEQTVEEARAFANGPHLGKSAYRELAPAEFARSSKPGGILADRLREAFVAGSEWERDHTGALLTEASGSPTHALRLAVSRQLPQSEPSDAQVRAAARTLNTNGWTCDGGNDEPDNYDQCEDCQRCCDGLARAVLRAAAAATEGGEQHGNA